METNVFVKFLPHDCGDDDLYALFSPFGVILSAKVMVNVSTGLSLGYGFVRYAHKEAAASAIKTMAGYRIGNKSLMCKLSDSFSFSNPSPNLYVKPLPLCIKEDDLKDMFGKFGTIVNTKVIKASGSIGDSNVGFVRYTNLESANLAIQEMNNTKIAGQEHLLIVKYAESDTQRVARKASIQPDHAGTPPPAKVQRIVGPTPTPYMNPAATQPMFVQVMYYWPGTYAWTP